MTATTINQININKLLHTIIHLLLRTYSYTHKMQCKHPFLITKKVNKMKKRKKSLILQLLIHSSHTHTDLNIHLHTRSQSKYTLNQQKDNLDLNKNYPFTQSGTYAK